MNRLLNKDEIIEILHGVTFWEQEVVVHYHLEWI